MTERIPTTQEDERLKNEANQQKRSRILEETLPGPIGSTLAFRHKGFLGFGGYKVIHEISQNSCGWRDDYHRDPPTKGSSVRIRCEKVTP